MLSMTGQLGSSVLLLVMVVVSSPACRISEFPCRNGRCIRLDLYCDGVDDCGDKSDEPKYCTVCNRTYYGDVGKTYELELHKPREDRLPFLCHLTFTANGHLYGELVQLIFDAFHVGRYESAALDGCPDGYMQLAELGRPFTGGSWCGSSNGYAVYYSETTTVTVSVKLFHSRPNENFEFRIRYKFVNKEEAVVRFGAPGALLERGEAVPGTYCSRNFYECYRKQCRLQSPNYPGMYPRNVTCYMTLRQKTVPACKHAMITVRQESEHKMQIKRALAGLNKTERVLRAWQDCTGERDHLIFYDGSSTDDPVLVKFCGGDWLPKVVSRGPEMLVAFHSSPFSIPLHSKEPSPLRGFELDVEVIFVDSKSMDFARDPSRCEFSINSTLDVRSGSVVSPRHTLPPNSTCIYRFKGEPGDLVWLYFLSYSHQLLKDSGRSDTNCSTRVRIWDGGGPLVIGEEEGDGSILGDHCDSDPPRLCDHAQLSNLTRVTRPCSHQESYVSSSSRLTVEHHTEDGTALHPTTFEMRYEFVDTRVAGEPYRRGLCSRIFRSGRKRSAVFSSPKNVFLYGRGGAQNLSCTFRFEAGSAEKIRITILNASFADRVCVTEPDPHTGRQRCVHSDPEDKVAEVQVWELPWRDVRMQKVCVCDNTTAVNLAYLASARIVELRFVITYLNITEDYADFYFNAKYEFVKVPECSRRQRLRGSGGEIEFRSPAKWRQDIYCEGLPWLVEAHANRSLFLMTWGSIMPNEPTPDDRCSTRNRLLLFSAKPAELKKVVCPASPNSKLFAVEVFSDDWFGIQSDFLQPPRPPSFLVEFVAREPGVHALNWLEISRSKPLLLENHIEMNETIECPFKCPELNACISGSLWCDGRKNCPSGYDESEENCARFAIPELYIYVGGSAGAAFLLLICIMVVHKIRVGRRKKQEARRVPTEELLIDPHEQGS